MNPASLELRLEKIESVLAHLQHDIDSLHISLTRHFQTLTEFDSRFRRIEGELQILSEAPDRPDLRDERPPHY